MTYEDVTPSSPLFPSSFQESVDKFVNLPLDMKRSSVTQLLTAIYLKRGGCLGCRQTNIDVGSFRVTFGSFRLRLQYDAEE